MEIKNKILLKDLLTEKQYNKLCNDPDLEYYSLDTYYTIQVNNKILFAAGGTDSYDYFIYDTELDKLYKITNETVSYNTSNIDNPKYTYTGDSFFVIQKSVWASNKDKAEIIILDSEFNFFPNWKREKNYIYENAYFSPEIYTLICDNRYCQIIYNRKIYIVDNKYNVIAKDLKYRVSTKHNISFNAKEFLLENYNVKTKQIEFYVYDIEKQTITSCSTKILSNIHGCVCFIDNNKNIRSFNNKTGRFEIYQEYDKFIENLELSNIQCRNIEFHNKKAIKYGSGICFNIYNEKNDSTKLYLVYGNNIINKDCPYDSIEGINFDDMEGPTYNIIVRKDSFMDTYDLMKHKFESNMLELKSEKISWLED